MEERTEQKPKGFNDARNSLVQRAILLLLLAVLASLYIGATIVEFLR